DRELTAAVSVLLGEETIGSDEQLATVLAGGLGTGARATFGPEGRLADMDREGVTAAVLISGDLGCPPVGMPLDAETAWCRLQNDWLADTYGSHLDRFAPGMHLPLSDLTSAVREL